MDHFIYLLRIKGNVYKFGITNDTTRRFAEHKIALEFVECVYIWKVLGEPKARAVERNTKKWLAESNLLVNYLDNNNHYQTEIFVYDDIEAVKAFIGMAIENPEVIEHAERTNPTCEKCGKKFISNRDLERHKNKKKPCIITDLSDEDINNPNRCVLCNKIYVQKVSLNRHLIKCRLKTDVNGKRINTIENQCLELLYDLRVEAKRLREQSMVMEEKINKCLSMMGVDIDD